MRSRRILLFYVPTASLTLAFSPLLLGRLRHGSARAKEEFKKNKHMPAIKGVFAGLEEEEE